jgi:hypothetical protein
MSAGAVGVFAPESARMPSPTARPRLRLIRPDERAGPQERLGPRDRVWQPASSTMQYTRRGRLVIALVAAAGVALLTVLLAATVDAAAPAIDHTTTVVAGQTLSEVAAVQLPGLPIRDAVARIQLVNGLNSSQVHAGQSLLIPALP